MRLAVVLVASITLGGCDQLFGLQEFPYAPDAAGAPWLEGYAFRKAVEIVYDAPVDGFPVSIVRTDDADLREHAHLMGDDIVFADDRAERLPHEIVKFAKLTGELDAWVRVPELVNGTTTIYLYYGGAPVLPRPGDVWTDFAAVWHMSGGLGLMERDSTDNGNDVTADVNEKPMAALGVAGESREYDGDNDAMCRPTTTSLERGDTSFSFSIWVYISMGVGFYDGALVKGGGNATTPGYAFELGDMPWEVMVADGGGPPRVLPYPTAPLSRWAHLAAVVDRVDGSFHAYLDGEQIGIMQLATFGSVSSSRNLCLGSADYAIRGRLDEARVHTRAVTPEWIRAEVLNVTKRETFTMFGAQESSPR